LYFFIKFLFYNMVINEIIMKRILIHLSLSCARLTPLGIQPCLLAICSLKLKSDWFAQQIKINIDILILCASHITLISCVIIYFLSLSRIFSKLLAQRCWLRCFILVSHFRLFGHNKSIYLKYFYFLIIRSKTFFATNKR